jgi:hypothetical protein
VTEGEGGIEGRVLKFCGWVLERYREREVWLEDWTKVNITIKIVWQALLYLDHAQDGTGISDTEMPCLMLQTLTLFISTCIM